MGQALEEARGGLSEGEVPVGAVLVDPTGHVLAKAHNRPIALHDPTAHAEILVLRKAGLLLQNYRLTGSVLVTTVEPCIMCMGAIVHARVAHLVFGARDSKAGAAVSLYEIGGDGRLNHRVSITSGVREEECRSLIKEFFKARR